MIDLRPGLKRVIAVSYFGQAASVAVFVTAMYVGWRANLRDLSWLVAWNVFIFAVNVGLFWWQGNTRARAKALLAQIENDNARRH